MIAKRKEAGPTHSAGNTHAASSHPASKGGVPVRNPNPHRAPTQHVGSPHIELRAPRQPELSPVRRSKNKAARAELDGLSGGDRRTKDKHSGKRRHD